MSSQLPTEDKPQEFWDIKLEIDGDICQKRKLVLAFNKALIKQCYI